MTGVGFFAPFPLALMIPFMAGQSLAMGEAFGKGFQYGKRKISSMSNEDFNALDFKSLSESLATDYRTMIPSLEQSIRASDKLQSAVIQEMGDLIKSIPDEILRFFDTASGQSTSTIQQTAFSGSIGIPAGPLAGSPQDQFGVVKDLGEEALKKVLPGSLGGTTTTQSPASILAFNQNYADNWIKNNPIPSQPDWVLAIASHNKSGPVWTITTQKLSGSIKGSRRKSQSSNLNLSKLKQNLSWYLTEYYKFRNDSTKKQNNNLEVFWRKVIKYSQFIITYNAIYI